MISVNVHIIIIFISLDLLTALIFLQPLIFIYEYYCNNLNAY